MSFKPDIFQMCIFWNTDSKVLRKAQELWAAFIMLTPTETSVLLGCNFFKVKAETI